MNVTFGGTEVHLVGTHLNEGDSLPNFTLTTRELSTFTRNDVKLPALFLTFPSVDTGVCSLELLTFNDRLENTNYNVYGVSMDLPFALDRWVKTNAGDYITMLSDHRDQDFGMATGTLIDELKILARTVMIFDKDGKPAYQEILPEIGSEPDYDKVMDEAKKHFA